MVHAPLAPHGTANHYNNTGTIDLVADSTGYFTST
jgi:hypothetical protein